MTHASPTKLRHVAGAARALIEDAEARLDRKKKEKTTGKKGRPAHEQKVHVGHIEALSRALKSLDSADPTVMCPSCDGTGEEFGIEDEEYGVPICNTCKGRQRVSHRTAAAFFND